MTEEIPGSNSRHNLLLAIAFALPLVFILTALIVSYLPAATLDPQYSFVYASCSQGSPPYYYNCGTHLKNRYAVEDGVVVAKELPPDLDSDGDGVLDIDENYETRLFYHDTTLNQGSELTITEAGSLILDTKITAPDGIAMEWEYRRSGSFFPFFDGPSRYGYYLTRGNVRDRLNLVGDGERSYYRDDLMFLGWVIE